MANLVEPDFDVVIIGSGVAGALVAYGIANGARRAHRILVIEAGGEAPDRGSLYEIYARNSNKGQDSPYADAFTAPEPRQSAKSGRDYYIDAIKGDPTDPALPRFMSFYQRLVGGSGWHWQGIALRMVPSDFRTQTLFGKGFDWPVGCRYHDLEKWYGVTEREMGVAGDSVAFQNFFGAHRSTPFPMPPIPPSYLDKRFIAAISGSKFRGLDVHVTAVAQARNSVNGYDGRPACDGRSTCIPLCPTKAKYEAIFHLEKAKQLRPVSIEIWDRSIVTHLEVGDEQLVSRVHFKRWDNSTGTASGRIVVLAANAIETPMILLSPLGNVAGGVANSSGAVGRYLMDHPIRMSYALANEPMHPYRGPLTTSSIESMRDGSFRRYRAAFRTSIRNDGWTWPTGAPLGYNPDSRGSLANLVSKSNLFGRRLRDELINMTSRQIVVNSASEMLPSADNYVRPSGEFEPRFGLRRPELRYVVDEYAHQGLEFAVEFHKYIFAKLGVTEQAHDPEFKYSGSGHIMGTTMMGKVVDVDCRAYDHPNLFILGSSVFPTAATANPTLTIGALALRAAETIKHDLG